MDSVRLGIPGVVELRPKVFRDDRGSFTKVFQKPWLEELGLETGFVEEYYSVSRRGVIRGMHFQVPPMDHAKLVYCVAGEVQDVVVDLRTGSPTYGQAVELQLSREKGNAIYIPRGMAHGFCALSDEATLVYKVSSVHSPAHDQGILWNSVNVVWRSDRPVLSARDQGFARLDEFRSPFHFVPESRA